MRPEILAALLASAVSTPWAIRPEALVAMRRSLSAGAVNALPALKPEADARLRAIVATDLDAPVSVAAISERPKAEGEQPEEAGAPLAAIHPATEKAVARKPGSVAVIPVRGTISSRITLFDMLFGGRVTPPQWIAAQAKRAMEDEAIKAVVFDYDSPGGVTTGVAEAASAIFALRGRKPMVSQVSGQMCSAAYHIGCSSDEIVATPTALVGSIGVYMLHDDYSGLYEQLGIKETYISAGKYKVETNDTQPLSDGARAHLQELVDDFYGLFIDAVARGRGVAASVAKGEPYGQGRTYIAARAVERGLADKVRTLDDTLLTYGVAPDAEEPQSRRATTGRSVSMLRMQAEVSDL